mmetsp:Transcript_30612/g.68558  ORF Transcript_30612/g.68558 Transcript_30612/m.68558 type:complete len:222 (-) Transcript_30612:164-829(-)
MNDKLRHGLLYRFHTRVVTPPLVIRPRGDVVRHDVDPVDGVAGRRPKVLAAVQGHTQNQADRMEVPRGLPDEPLVCIPLLEGRDALQVEVHPVQPLVSANLREPQEELPLIRRYVFEPFGPPGASHADQKPDVRPPRSQLELPRPPGLVEVTPLEAASVPGHAALVLQHGPRTQGEDYKVSQVDRASIRVDVRSIVGQVAGDDKFFGGRRRRAMNRERRVD